LTQEANEQESPDGTVVVDASRIVDGDGDGLVALNASLNEIRKLKGVLGYILRNETSAIVDLSEQGNLTQLAILSSRIHDSLLDVAKQFSLGEVECMLVEGKTMKVLCMSVAANRISVFMEKNATHAWIIKRILL
jgi:predicted regulator of Ras-like GTPase activity (Roadblock/LC7/MglB family)